MNRFLLRCETFITTPFFITAWYMCAIWFAIVAGRDMAKADEEQKAELLKTLLPHNTDDTAL